MCAVLCAAKSTVDEVETEGTEVEETEKINPPHIITGNQYLIIFLSIKLIVNHKSCNAN